MKIQDDSDKITYRDLVNVALIVSCAILPVCLFMEAVYELTPRYLYIELLLLVVLLCYYFFNNKNKMSFKSIKMSRYFVLPFLLSMHLLGDFLTFDFDLLKFLLLLSIIILGLINFGFTVEEN